MPQSRTNLNPEPKTNSPYLVGVLLRYSTFAAAAWRVWGMFGDL